MLEIATLVKNVDEEEDDINDEYRNYNIFRIIKSKIVDAFVALGGDPDRSGRVRKQTIINVIKNEFELAFDMEDFLEKVGATSDELDFQSFCLLFDGRDDDKSVSRAHSVLSVIINSHNSFLYNN